MAIPIMDKGTRTENGFQADLIVQGELLIEIKSVDALAPVHDAQVLSCLRLGGFTRRLLMSFTSKLLRDGVRRFAMERPKTAGK